MKNSSYKIYKKTYNRNAFRLLTHSITNFFMPSAYTRTREIPEIINISGILSDKRDNLRILDISSPQLLSLSLASVNSSWSVTYINPFDKELYDMSFRADILKIKNIVTLKENIQNTDLQQIIGKFDYIFSSSVFEHIYPENGGDAKAAKNLKSLLNPQGICSISVPFYKKAFNEYTSGNVYFIENKSSKPIFFQRFYDIESLKNDIISPSELHLQEQFFVGERFYFPNNINKRLGTVLARGRFIFVLGRLFNILSSAFMTKKINFDELKKPYLAFIKLVNND